MSAAEVGDSLEVTSLAVGSALIRGCRFSTDPAERNPACWSRGGFLAQGTSGTCVGLGYSLDRINTVISDLNFCRHLHSNTLGMRSIPKIRRCGRHSRLRREVLPSSRLLFRPTVLCGSAPRGSFIAIQRSRELGLCDWARATDNTRL
jgi:hypothetical protein